MIFKNEDEEEVRFVYQHDQKELIRNWIASQEMDVPDASEYDVKE